MAANFTCRGGEIDLIMRDGSTLVFIEVRQRRAGAQVTAWESIGPRKQQRMRTAALSYLAKRQISAHQPCRFDVIAIEGETQLRWVQDAL